MARSGPADRSRPDSPVSWFALLQQARIDRNRTLFELACGHLASLGIHVSFIPSPSSAHLGDEQVITRIVDRLFARFQTAGVELRNLYGGSAAPTPPDSSV